MISSNRATLEEKAEAWDRFMKSQNPSVGKAAMEAWQWLTDTVHAREAQTDKEAGNGR